MQTHRIRKYYFGSIFVMILGGKVDLYLSFFCYDKIIVETKALSELLGNNQSQVINYLKATGFKLGLLINFGAESLEYKRLVRY